MKVVRDVETPADGDEPTLVVDGDARPVGWIDPAAARPRLRSRCHLRPGPDTLRIALDSALTSPVGLAVAVETGRPGGYAGVVTAGTSWSR